MQVKLLIFVAAISASLLPATAALSETFSVSALTWVQPQQTVLDTKITKPVISVGGQITRTDQLPTLRLQKLRKILVAKGFVGAVQLRELADAGDSLASLKLAQRMETRDSFQEKSDAIHYYTKAVLWGRTYAALPLLNLLKSIATTKLQPSRLAEAEKALLVAAKQEGKSFIDSFFAVYQAGTIFKGGEEAGERLLRQLANAGDASLASPGHPPPQSTNADAGGSDHRPLNKCRAAMRSTANSNR